MGEQGCVQVILKCVSDLDMIDQLRLPQCIKDNMKKYTALVTEIETIATETKQDLYLFTEAPEFIYQTRTFHSLTIEVFRKEKEEIALAYSKICQDFSWIKAH